MEALLEKGIEGLNLDRSDWKLVKFGDVAIQQKQTVDRENTALTRYVKGEHMYSEDLHLREWGELKDEYLGPAFIRRFETGDILYGSRRTYLRKVVVAPFDGITSNTTFVIKANEERIDKRLLPYIMLSEGFAQHSIRNSKGSVNPYVNWKDLSGYEFLLPPLSKQPELSELFSCLDIYLESNHSLLHSAENNLNAVIDYEIFRNENLTREKVKFSNLISDIISGVSVKSTDEDLDGRSPSILKTSAITGGTFRSDEAKVVVGDDLSRLKSSVRKDTILFNRKNTKKLVGSSKYIDRDHDNIFLPDLIWELTIDDKKYDPKFVSYFISTNSIRRKISSLSNGTNESMVNISQKQLLAMNVVIPVKRHNKPLRLMFEDLDAIAVDIKTKINATYILRKSLINQVF